MAVLTVKQKFCAKCGVCAESCPLGIIGMSSDGPQMFVPDACCACGHCVASCPNAALDNDRAPLKNQEPLEKFPVIDPKTAASFLRSRRSIRRYQAASVPREKILQLLEIARFAPSGHNSQGISYVVIDDPEILKKISAVTVDWLEELVKENVPWVQGFTGMIELYRNTGTDTILRDAPCLIVAAAPNDFGMGQDNARFSLEYIELYATSLGLGTCWAGFVQLCAGANFPPLMELIKVTEGIAVVGALMAGFPKYTYRRLVGRNPLQVNWI